MKFTIRLSFMLLLLALIATTVIAQGNGNDDDPTPRPDPDTPPPAEENPPPANNDDEDTPPTPPANDDEEATPPGNDDEDAPPPPAEEEGEEPAPAPPKTTTTEEDAESTTAKTTSTGPAPPRFTTSTTSSLPPATTPSGTPQGFPTTAPSGPPKPKLFPTYAPPAVPYTANAPFMQESSLPQGTFFIAVGAALGLLLFAVVAWRAIVAWSLHRSVKRAADEANSMDKTSLMRPPPGGGSGGFYAAGAGSALSLGDLGGNFKSSASKQTPNSSLFFSPTAGVGATAGDRRSAYLPAGYYPTASASGNGLGGGPMGASQTHFPSQSISSGRFGSRGGLGPSPPGSPLMPPSRGNGSGTVRGSESRTSLSLPPTGRAPSAYLEDLFENHQQQPGGRY